MARRSGRAPNCTSYPFLATISFAFSVIWKWNPKSSYSLDQSFQVEVDDALDGIEIQLVEGDDVVETVQKLWSKLLAQTLLDDAAGILLVFLIHRQSAFYTCRSKADASAEIFQLAGSCVRGHDDDGVAEVDESAVAIGKSAFVEYL